MKTTKLNIVLFTACGLSLLNVGQAEAYKTHGRYSRDRVPVKYRINPKGMPYGIEPVKQAAQNWSNKKQFHFAFKFDGFSNAGRTNQFNNVAMSSRINRGALAMCWWTRKGGYLSGFDIGMNSHTRTSKGRWSNTILHELGHALGLLHTSNSRAVMEAGSGSGNNLLDLHADDIRGAVSLYPPRGRHPGFEPEAPPVSSPAPPVSAPTPPPSTPTSPPVVVSAPPEMRNPDLGGLIGDGPVLSDAPGLVLPTPGDSFQPPANDSGPVCRDDGTGCNTNRPDCKNGGPGCDPKGPKCNKKKPRNKLFGRWRRVRGPGFIRRMTGR
jgi:hypothetical protein